MKITLQHKDLTIDFFDDPLFSNSSENSALYHKIYQPGKEYIPTSQHAVIIYKSYVTISSAILLVAAGATSVTPDSILIDEDNLILRCSNTVFSLTLPDLNLNWMTEADWATCFSIHKYQDSYITHGETSIARIDKKGNILWSYSGADIFVCLEEGNPFEMHDNYIELTDFNGGKYKIDYNGKKL
ncbi:hypothetical protein FAM09_16670 [Niastella caeni]|uniref:Uncharacterized protein n=1 Tax=Niastella caeni TaxID=2569763 RepID=A0A4S8HUI9_9BACT|nr:hypothetical protein [Niastella caeni]THU38309.1 hypothetical protein FAM09_16670 [Niastella caeni]